MKRIFLLLLLLPILSNCTQYSAVIGPSITLAHTGSFAQASTALSKSIAINEVKKEYVANSLTVERICPTAHSAEINKIFFETIEEMDCYYDPLSILR